MVILASGLTLGLVDNDESPSCVMADDGNCGLLLVDGWRRSIIYKLLMVSNGM